MSDCVTGLSQSSAQAALGTNSQRQAPTTQIDFINQNPLKQQTYQNQLNLPSAGGATISKMHALRKIHGKGLDVFKNLP